MNDLPEPDPRFDPRYQRGYDGPEPDAPPTPAMPSPVARSDSARPPTAGGGAGSEADSAPPVGAVLQESVAADDAADDFWAPPRRNPYALALLVGGLAMIAVGLWLIWSVVTQSSFPDGNDRAAQAFGLVQQQLTPALVIAGFVGVVGWLVLGALGPSGRKRE
jgi:hypothetical protein